MVAICIVSLMAVKCKGDLKGLSYIFREKTGEVKFT